MWYELCETGFFTQHDALRASQVGCVTVVPASGPRVFNPLCTEEHAGGFQCGATTQEATVNTCVHLSVWTSFSFYWVNAREHDFQVAWYMCVQLN